eukprot:694884-Pelagomonas_calceolata.AAC.2
MVCVQANGSKLSLCQSRCKPQTLVIWGCSLVRMHCKDWVRASTHNHVPVISRAKCAQAGEGRVRNPQACHHPLTSTCLHCR